MGSGQRIHLLVVPSHTAPDVAQQLLKRAADERNTRTAGELLALAASTALEGLRLRVWDDDGGAAGPSD